jgi:hypothetical protein
MKLHVDGTNAEGYYESGATPWSVAAGEHRAPFAVFDEDAQRNVAGPFLTYGEAANALILKITLQLH